MDIVSILRSRFIPILILFTVFSQAMGQVKFTTIASSKEIGKADYVEIEFVVENAQQIDQIVQPVFTNFLIIRGPNQSSGMTISNGAMSQYTSLSFVLQPTKTGIFILPGTTASINGKTMRSNPVTIRVHAGSVSHYQPLPQPGWPEESPDTRKEYRLRKGEDINEKIRKNLFVKVQVSKTSCYVGEPIVATYKLYSRLQSESRVSKHPSLNGFSVYDMIDPSRDASSVETINGKPFTVHIIRKAQLIPLQAGKVNLDPVEVENTVHFVRGNGPEHRRSSNPFQELFDRFSNDEEESGRIDQQVTLTSKPLEISIRALPTENRPENFNGAVGHFTLEAQIDSGDVVANDGAVLKLTVKGSGNLPVVNAPTVQWPAGIESYAARAKEEMDKTVAPLTGSKTFEYKFVAGHSGQYTIPSVAFSYFDPSKAAYKTLKTGSLNLPVAAGKAHAVWSPDPGQAAAAAGRDRSGTFKNFIQQYLEWVFAIVILSALAIYLMVQNRLHKKTSRQAKLMEEQAAAAAVTAPVPEDRFLLSRQLFEAGNYRAFYSELNRAIWKAIADKLPLHASELNKHNIVFELRSRGWDQSSIRLLEDILNECEVKLYTPGYSETDLLRILNNAEEIVKKLEM